MFDRSILLEFPLESPFAELMDRTTGSVSCDCRFRAVVAAALRRDDEARSGLDGELGDSSAASR
jgi:hypothetical protein